MSVKIIMQNLYIIYNYWQSIGLEWKLIADCFIQSNAVMEVDWPMMKGNTGKVVKGCRALSFYQKIIV